MVASPKIPANLPILYTCFPCCDRRANFHDRVENPVGCSKLTRLKLTRPSLRPNDSSYQWSRRLLATVLIDHKAFRHQILGFCQLGVAIVMNCSQRFAYFYPLADAFVEFQAHGMVNPVFLSFPATAQHRQRDAKLLAVCSHQHSEI